MTDDARRRRDRRSTIDLAHNLGLKVVAEGVEDRGTLDLLRGWAATSPRATTWAGRCRAEGMTAWLREHCDVPAPAES